jgi:uncharacterized protein
MKILIAGGSGFLGTALIQSFLAKGYELVVLTRGRSRAERNVRWVNWDGATLGKWIEELTGVDVLINLTGKNVNCRYNERNKSEILRSRTDSVYALSRGIAQAGMNVPLWIQASSATIYRHAEDRPMTESDGDLSNGFSVSVCKAWEEAFAEVKEAERKVVMRTAIVLGRNGGAWPLLKRLAKFGLGGRMGKGSQYVSWLHIGDFIKMVEWFINEKHSHGIYNCTAPEPLPNREFMQRMSIGSSALIDIPTPEWLLRIGAFAIGTETELILKSRWILPVRLKEEGFKFAFPDLDSALSNLFNHGSDHY